MVRTAILILVFFFYSCISKSDGVFLDEMMYPPKLSIDKEKLCIQLSNSKIHSAKRITQLEFYQSDNKWNIQVFQALTDLPFVEYSEVFHIDLSEYGLDTNFLDKNEIYWVNPDNSKHLINMAK